MLASSSPAAFALALFVLAGCPSTSIDNPPTRAEAGVKDDAAEIVVNPDAAEPGLPDAAEVIVSDAGVTLRSTNLAPAVGRAAGPNHKVEGKLGASSPTTATGAQHKVQGGLGPLSPKK